MAMPEGPNVLVSRQSVLLATGVGVGLLTLVYVLGVQVGKQSAALQAGARTGGAELKELPAPLTEQLKAFELEVAQLEKARPEESRPAEPAKAEPPAAAKKEPPAKEAAKIEPKAESRTGPKPEPAKATPPPAAAQPAAAKKEVPKPGERWTQQLVTTTDPGEAKRIAAKAKEAGFDTVEVKSGDTIRVRIKGIHAKADADAIGARLKEKGLKPFAVKTD